MKSGTYRQDSLLIVYDAEQVQHPRADLFDPGYWDKRGCVTGEAVGRGSAWFIDAPFGAAVLRRYLRGGMMARISRDRYLFTGWARSRPVAEFRVLERLAAAGLPVPAPLAAGLRRRGLVYTGGLITRPTLEWLLDSPAAGPQQTRIAYETSGMTWWADYTIVYDESTSCTMDLSAWVTIINQSGASYQDARLKLIAGDVNRAERRSPAKRDVVYRLAMEEAPAAAPFAERAFFEYHLYDLPRPTTIRTSQMKQIGLLTAAAVPFEKLLIFDGIHGGDVRVVYSPLDAVQIAKQNPTKQVVFFAIGFETTTPPTAVAILQAEAEGLTNFSVFCNHVLTPAAIRAILDGAPPGPSDDPAGLAALEREWRAKTLDWWEASPRRRALKEQLREQDGVDPDDVIMGPGAARRRGLGGSAAFPVGNLGQVLAPFFL